MPEFFTFVEVSEWIKAIVPNKALLRFPRAAIVASNHEGRRLCYLLLNLFLALAVVPTAWMREICNIRKRGPQVVTDLRNIRPISFTDDLQTLFDMAWLARCREKLERYVGAEQGGGRFDSTLIAIGAVVGLQTRRNCQLLC